MWKNQSIYFLITIISALLLGYLTVSNVLARESRSLDRIAPPPETDQVTPTLGVYPTKTMTPTPEPTIVFNLPMVQQAPLQTNTPSGSGEQTPPPTPTPTQIPPQDADVNFPIVFGAAGIVSIIFLAWLVAGRKHST
jgi:hypothetical protein